MKTPNLPPSWPVFAEIKPLMQNGIARWHTVDVKIEGWETVADALAAK